MNKSMLKKESKVYNTKRIDPVQEINVRNELRNAVESGDIEKFVGAQIKLSEIIEKRVLSEFDASLKSNDTSSLVNPLTKEEREYYNEVITEGGFAGAEKAMPPTIFERVFEDLRAEHPLLSEIEFVNTTGVTEWISRNNDVSAAWWGAICAEITKKLEVAFKKENPGLYKLSAYLPICNSMLDLGPEWLDRFARVMMFESLAIALELAIVAGTGKDQPIGMMKNLAGAVVEGVYPDKMAIPFNSFTPESLGADIMAPLTKNGTRTVSSVLMIVNPLDYADKIYPHTSIINDSGQYVIDTLPIPAKLIPSFAVPQGIMIAGRGKDYFMGVGSSQKIDFSDHYKFLEDERTYIAKMYANGKPLDNDSYLVFDISGLQSNFPVFWTLYDQRYLV